MSHSLNKIWIHGVFSVKGREKLINSNFEQELYNHIKDRLEKDFDCKVKIINGIEDHIHLLFLLSLNFCIKDIFKNIKGESSHWINQSGFLTRKFSWQVGYGAFSVSESKVGEVEKYIRNQKEHHKKISHLEEVELFVRKYGVKFENH